MLPRRTFTATPNFLKSDRDQERPSKPEVDEMLARLRLEPWPLTGRGFEALLAAVRAAYVNGGVLFARFRLPGDPVLHWFGSRNRLDETRFFKRLLTGPEVSAALPELQLENQPAVDPGFEWGSAFTLDGELARILSVGGAYERFPGSAREAKELAGRGCRDLFGERYDEVLVYRSTRLWSPWFQDVAWDASWLGIDKRELSVWLLCVTDTD